MNSVEPTKASAPQVIAEVALILAAILHRLETPSKSRVKVAPQRTHQRRTEQALRRLAKRPPSIEKSRALLDRGFRAISLQVAAMQRKAKKSLSRSGSSFLQESVEERLCKSEESARRLLTIVKQIRNQIDDFFAALESGQECYYAEPGALATEATAPADPASPPCPQTYPMKGQR
jgi:hypothetical protein